MSSRTPSKIVSSRASSGSRADVRQHPDATARRRPSLPWTIPYPHAAVPGSMPRTFTGGSYAGARTFLPQRGELAAGGVAVRARPGLEPFGRSRQLLLVRVRERCLELRELG